MAKLACNCGKFVIATKNYPEPYNYFYDRGVHYLEMVEKSLLRIKDFLPSQSVPQLFEVVAARLRGSSFPRRERFVKCPVCGRIHIFWLRGDGVTVVTYALEEIEEYSLSVIEGQSNSDL